MNLSKNLSILLIEPFGIETFALESNFGRSSLLLIEPFGIETK